MKMVSKKRCHCTSDTGSLIKQPSKKSSLKGSR